MSLLSEQHNDQRYHYSNRQRWPTELEKEKEIQWHGYNDKILSLVINIVVINLFMCKIHYLG